MSHLLKRYLERRYIDRRDKLVSAIFGKLGAYLRSRKVWKRLNNKAYHADHEGDPKTIRIQSYAGNNPTVKSVQNFLKKFRHPAIEAAIVQGSISTGQENAFSDFDGILLIDLKKITSRKNLVQLHTIVHESAHIMKKQDVLQHHGWSILFKQELKRYPDSSLPALLLSKGKVIFPETELDLQIIIDPDHQDYNTLYENICNGIYRRLNHPETFKKYYYTKLLISECLLLPSAFIQAIERKPIWKGDSFSKIEVYLNKEHLTTLSRLSDIRDNWHIYFNGKRKNEPVNTKLSALLMNELSEPIKDLIDYLDKKLEIQGSRS